MAVSCVGTFLYFPKLIHRKVLSLAIASMFKKNTAKIINHEV